MSGETKWTPGPWVVSDSQDEVSVCMGTAIDSPYEYTCGHVWQTPDVYWSEADKEDIANAQLIAAAPDLYEALEDMLSGWKYIRESHGDLYGVGWDRAQNKARAALAKARGECQ